MVFKAGQGSGSSGSFFFYSYDNKFLIKTLTNAEKEVFLDRLLGFLSYFKQHNNQTLIAKIYGVFTIKSNIFNDLNVMIM